MCLAVCSKNAPAGKYTPLPARVDHALVLEQVLSSTKEHTTAPSLETTKYKSIRQISIILYRENNIVIPCYPVFKPALPLFTTSASKKPITTYYSNVIVWKRGGVGLPTKKEGALCRERERPPKWLHEDRASVFYGIRRTQG